MSRRTSARAHPLEGRVRALSRATAHLDPPFAVVDAAALAANADDLVARAGGLPIRVASKSVRVRSVMADVLARPGFHGVLAYSLAEALWLVGHGFDDVLVAYPSVDRAAIARLGADPAAQRAVAVVVDDVDQLRLMDAIVPDGACVRVMVDVDASLWLGRVRVGSARSPVRTPQDAAALAREVERRPWAQVAGVLVYDAQVAGQPDTVATRVMKRASVKELAPRRAAIVQAVQAVVPGRRLVVDAGGTGSVHLFGDDPCVTEVAAGSGLFAPALFDGYDAFSPTPASYFVTSVVRRPGPATATVYSGGYSASGSAGASRLPTPVWPPGLRFLPWEGAGEVQTPLVGRGARGLAVGDRVWFRHAKAGEMCERFDQVHLVGDDGSIDTRSTYRGEGQNFG